MTMKRIVAALLGIFLLSLNAGAQKVFYLFPEFTDGEILFQGLSRPARVKMNIDAIGQRIFYFQGDMLMELTNPDMVRTIKLGERMFLMKEGLLCEAIRQWESFTLLVNWKFKNVDNSEDNQITDSDRTVIGNALPILYGGFNNTFVFKNLDLSVYFTYSYGNDILNAGHNYTMTVSPNSRVQVWTPSYGRYLLFNLSFRLNKKNSGTEYRGELQSGGEFLPPEARNAEYEYRNSTRR